MALYFAIKLTADDRGLLEDIQRYFDGIGKIYRVKPTGPKANTRSGWTKESSYFRVTRMDQLAIVANHFSRYPLRGTKARSFEIWLEMLHAKQRFRRPQLDQLALLASDLSDRAVRNRPWQGAEAGDVAKADPQGSAIKDAAASDAELGGMAPGKS
jgi:hypothetical protein